MRGTLHFRYVPCPLLVLLILTPSLLGAETGVGSVSELDCGYRDRDFWLGELRSAVVRGEIADPRTRVLPAVAPRRAPIETAILPCISSAHIHPYEDTDGFLLTDFSTGALIDFMTVAANDLLATRGDQYDFVGFWVNFEPHHQIGAAFYMPIENDVSGTGNPLFNDRLEMGLAGNNVEGYVMMWNIDSSSWQPGSGPSADFTRLALGQEFEHRFGMFLPDLPGGIELQGDGSGCGRPAHWNWKVDGQGSAMEISEWVGEDPAIPEGTFISFNTDIPGSVFSYTDLYLMGYVSAAEMDAGNSELRYLHDSNCSSSYSGDVTSLSSADVVSEVGPRVPDSTSSQKYFRTGWIMIHLPGDPPSQSQLDKAAAILEQHMMDWRFGTLGRGAMNDTLFDDCNCNGVDDLTDIAQGTSPDTNGNNFPDECESPPCVNFDCDGDGVLNAEDNCPWAPNPNQDDPDGDTLGSQCDNCPWGFNPDQGPAVFAEAITAQTLDDFCWSTLADVVWVRGDLDEVAEYTFDVLQTENLATCLQDAVVPVSGAGFYYVLKPACAVGSWQSGSEAEPGRDAQLP